MIDQERILGLVVRRRCQSSGSLSVKFAIGAKIVIQTQVKIIGLIKCN